MQTLRQAKIERTTKETAISLALMLDGTGEYQIETGVPFFDHMLTLFAVHGSCNLEIKASGDTEVDDHHTVEDIGICLGQALAQCLGDKSGIARYSSCFLPMDEALVQIVLDISNRPFLHYQVPITEQQLGTFDTMLGKEFFRAVSQHAGITLHIDLLHGENGHHILEAIFKGFARVVAAAVQPLDDGRVLSSKGCL